MNGISHTSGSKPQNVDMAALERDRRVDEILIGMADGASANFARTLEDTIGRNEQSRSESQQQADENRTSRREGERDSRAQVAREREGSRQGMPEERRSARVTTSAADAARSEPGASEASRPTAADAEPDSGADDLLKDMQAVQKNDTVVTNGTRPVATMTAANGAGAVRLDGGWRPIAVMTAQNQATPQQAPPESAATREQVLSSLLRHPGLSEGKGDIRLHLQPAHLGKVDVQLKRVGDRLEIHIRVESAAAEQALQDGADDLGQLLLGRSASWNEVSITVESSKTDEEEENPDGDPSQADDEADTGSDEPQPDDDQEGER